MLIIKYPINRYWKKENSFEIARSLSGETVREVKERKTLRFELGGEGFYLKYHRGISWGEIFKNLINFKVPVLGASNEWNAIQKLDEHGIDTMEGVAFGTRGLWPTRRESFIVTRDLSPCVSLEDFCKTWEEKRPDAKLKKRIIIKVAEIVRGMHDAGVNHRDCYICHFLLDLPYDPHGYNLKISIIDLHRSQIRREVPRRWRDKDLVALYFSSLNIGLTPKDYFLFLKHYFRMPLRKILFSESKFFAKLEQKTRKIKNHTQKWNL